MTKKEVFTFEMKWKWRVDAERAELEVFGYENQNFNKRNLEGLQPIENFWY